MLDYKPNMVISTQDYQVVGTRPVRHDGPDKVMGRARYAADIHLPGMLHAKMLRSPHAPRARIKNIDASKALALPGVEAVVTAADLPDILSGNVRPGGRRGRQLRVLQPQHSGPAKRLCTGAMPSPPSLPRAPLGRAGVGSPGNRI